jgi:lyso-ornithine lipid O-acyltransferase
MGRFAANGAAKMAMISGASLIGMPVQALALRFSPRLAARIPILFHKAVCRIMGVRIDHQGVPPQAGEAMLIVSNHVSWLDISVIGTTRPLAFVAKAEVRDWPGFGLLARLQRTVFVDRTRRSATSAVTNEMGARLVAGEAIVLFAEGTTGDGSRILPFKSSLLGAVREALNSGEAETGQLAGQLLVQPLTIIYRGRHGIAEGRKGRGELAWAGDVDLVPHLALVLNGGPIDVQLVWGEPIRAGAGDSRKAVTALAETRVREGFRQAIRT